MRGWFVSVVDTFISSCFVVRFLVKSLKIFVDSRLTLFPYLYLIHIYVD